MRENRTYGSEGGGPGVTTGSPYPYPLGSVPLRHVLRNAVPGRVPRGRFVDTLWKTFYGSPYMAAFHAAASARGSGI